MHPYTTYLQCLTVLHCPLWICKCCQALDILFNNSECFSTAITVLNHFANDSTEQKELCNLQGRICFQVKFAINMFSNTETFITSNKMIQMFISSNLLLFLLLLFEPCLVLADLILVAPFSQDSLSILVGNLIVNV